MNNKKILVTCALPYANGPLHLGHMLEHIQADIWVRYQKMIGNNVLFICADDAHGTPIMLKAQKLKINPEIMIKKIYQEHKKNLTKFCINYDNYYTTHSKENKKLINIIYKKLKKNRLIKSKIILQLYDPKNKMFLPDRLIKGTCPICKSIDQYGDICEICGATYNPIELINPTSIISKTTPIIKKTKHFFFNLPAFNNMLYNWIQSTISQKEIINKMQEWFKTGLKQWDISRDAPYFGFKIPNITEKYFYVWLDAPIGYMASFKNLCANKKNISFKDFWSINSTTKLFHFIGKDIIYFHCLFWPAILQGSGFRLPTNIFVHGYVTINGNKMSKSQETFITANTYLKFLNPDYIRYYYASKLSTNIDDIDLHLEDFIQKVNSDIINKIVNLAARCVGFITKNFNGQISDILDDQQLYDTFIKSHNIIDTAFQNREFNIAMKEIIKLANLANRYIDIKAPWLILKQSNNIQYAHNVYSMGIQLFRILMTYLKPVLPNLTKSSEDLLNTIFTIKNIQIPLKKHYIKPFKTLLKRITKEQIQSIINTSKNNI